MKALEAPQESVKPPHKHSELPTVPRKERRLCSSSVLLSSHSAASPGERRLILQAENFSIQTSRSERSRAGRVGRSWRPRDSSTPVIVYTDKVRVWSCCALPAARLGQAWVGAVSGILGYPFVSAFSRSRDRKKAKPKQNRGGGETEVFNPKKKKKRSQVMTV